MLAAVMKTKRNGDKELVRVQGIPADTGTPFPSLAHPSHVIITNTFIQMINESGGDLGKLEGSPAPANTLSLCVIALEGHRLSSTRPLGFQSRKAQFLSEIWDF